MSDANHYLFMTYILRTRGRVVKRVKDVKERVVWWV